MDHTTLLRQCARTALEFVDDCNGAVVACKHVGNSAVCTFLREVKQRCAGRLHADLLAAVDAARQQVAGEPCRVATLQHLQQLADPAVCKMVQEALWRLEPPDSEDEEERALRAAHQRDAAAARTPGSSGRQAPRAPLPPQPAGGASQVAGAPRTAGHDPVAAIQALLGPGRAAPGAVGSNTGGLPPPPATAAAAAAVPAGRGRGRGRVTGGRGGRGAAAAAVAAPPGAGPGRGRGRNAPPRPQRPAQPAGMEGGPTCNSSSEGEGYASDQENQGVAGVPLNRPPAPAATAAAAAAAAAAAIGHGEGEEEEEEVAPGRAKRGRVPREYLPRPDTFNYGFLVAMYLAHAGGQEVLTKADIMERAGAVMDRPLVNTSNAWSANAAEKWYGPWSGFKTLVTKGLVSRWSNPMKAALTPAGAGLAARLVQHAANSGRLSPAQLAGVVTGAVPQVLPSGGLALVAPPGGGGGEAAAAAAAAAAPAALGPGPKVEAVAAAGGVGGAGTRVAPSAPGRRRGGAGQQQQQHPNTTGAVALGAGAGVLDGGSSSSEEEEEALPLRQRLGYRPAAAAAMDAAGTTGPGGESSTGQAGPCVMGGDGGGGALPGEAGLGRFDIEQLMLAGFSRGACVEALLSRGGDMVEALCTLTAGQQQQQQQPGGATTARPGRPTRQAPRAGAGQRTGGQQGPSKAGARGTLGGAPVGDCCPPAAADGALPVSSPCCWREVVEGVPCYLDDVVLAFHAALVAGGGEGAGQGHPTAAAGAAAGRTGVGSSVGDGPSTQPGSQVGSSPLPLPLAARAAAALVAGGAPAVQQQQQQSLEPGGRRLPHPDVPPPGASIAGGSTEALLASAVSRPPHQHPPQRQQQQLVSGSGSGAAAGGAASSRAPCTTSGAAGSSSSSMGSGFPAAGPVGLDTLAAAPWRLPLLGDSATGGWSPPLRLPPLPPGTTYGAVYDTVLLLDNQERYGGRGRSRAAGPQGLARHLAHIASRLAGAAGAAAMQGCLSVGDAVWLARCKGQPQELYVLDFILERKTQEDLRCSVQERRNRYDDQKYRLRRSGSGVVLYLVEGEVEGLADKAQYGRAAPLPAGPSRLEADKQGNRSAALQVVAHAGFRLLETGCLGDTEALLADITRVLAQVYAPLTAASAPPGAAPAPRFEAWNAAMRAGKQRRTVGERWLEMLLAVPGLGQVAARSITTAYPTPRRLFDAYQAAICAALAGGRSGTAAAVGVLADLPLDARRRLGQRAAGRVYDVLFAPGWDLSRGGSGAPGQG